MSPGQQHTSPVWYALASAAVVTGCVTLFGQQMGTHRPAIHGLAAALAAGYAIVVLRPLPVGERLLLLGLARPHFTHWIWVLLAAGVAAGVSRFLVYRATGLGGLRLYEQAFVPVLAAWSAGEAAVRYALFIAGAYLAVLVPGVLFWAVIQSPFARTGALWAGLFLQSAVFGYCHCFMTGSFDLFYGFEAFLASLLSGLVFQRLGNVYVPSLFMASAVATSTFLLAWS
jgi:hypothetical protein